MKKLLTIAFALLLGASLSFAQATGTTSTDKPATADKTTKTDNTKSGKKGHKTSKKSKKGSSSTTPPPK